MRRWGCRWRRRKRVRSGRHRLVGARRRLSLRRADGGDLPRGARKRHNARDMTRHILITGGAGFIGSHIADAFLARGWRVSIIDNLSTGSRANVPREATLIEADVRDAKLDELRPAVA